MFKNILLYLIVLLSAFIFSIFFYEWFSWFLLVVVLAVPIVSLAVSLPFMIINAVQGFSVSTLNELTVGDELCFRIAGRHSFFCPLIKIIFKTSNDFAGKKKRLKFLYGGFLRNPVYRKTKILTQNCGCLNIKAKYGKVYDLLGIFFIPVKLNYNAEILIMPKAEKPTVLPDNEQMKIIGYKPKPSGFAEEYELRSYQQGDSLKNIHWKISARHNDLIVKEPSTPIYRPIIFKPVITKNCAENNITLGKFLYSANFIVKNKSMFYCVTPNNRVYLISNEDDIKRYLLHLYKKQSINNVTIGAENAISYTITHSGEVVSG